MDKRSSRKPIIALSESHPCAGIRHACTGSGLFTLSTLADGWGILVEESPPTIVNTNFAPNVPMRADIGFLPLISTHYFSTACPELAEGSATPAHPPSGRATMYPQPGVKRSGTLGTPSFLIYSPPAPAGGAVLFTPLPHQREGPFYLLPSRTSGRGRGRVSSEVDIFNTFQSSVLAHPPLTPTDDAGGE